MTALLHFFSLMRIVSIVCMQKTDFIKYIRRCTTQRRYNNAGHKYSDLADEIFNINRSKLYLCLYLFRKLDAYEDDKIYIYICLQIHAI